MWAAPGTFPKAPAPQPSACQSLWKKIRKWSNPGKSHSSNWLYGRDGQFLTKISRTNNCNCLTIAVIVGLKAEPPAPRISIPGNFRSTCASHSAARPDTMSSVRRRSKKRKAKNRSWMSKRIRQSRLACNPGDPVLKNIKP